MGDGAGGRENKINQKGGNNLPMFSSMDHSTIRNDEEGSIDDRKRDDVDSPKNTDG